MKCIYCNEEKEEKCFSLEHIFPKSLGGNYTNDIFKTNSVCVDCNSNLGIYVDSAVTKNFFNTSLSSFSDYLGYFDFQDKPCIPFCYMGFAEDVTHPNYEYCERWLWHGGSTVYHFHNNSKDMDTIAGGHSIRAKETLSEAYLVGLTHNKFWVELLFKAFYEKFNCSKRVSVNYMLPNHSVELNKVQKEIKEKVFNLHQDGKELSGKLVIDIALNVRFQAKLALGLGESLFGDNFSISSDAENLRTILWNRKYQNLERLQPKMLPFFSKTRNNLKDTMKFLNFKGCHGLFFFIQNNSLIFYANLFGEGKYPLLARITDKLDLFENELVDKHPNGWGYILVPQRKKMIGEFGIPSLLAYNTGDKSYIPELDEFEKKYKYPDELPPIHD